MEPSCGVCSQATDGGNEKDDRIEPDAQRYGAGQ
jgi:hypothetical protein